MSTSVNATAYYHALFNVVTPTMSGLVIVLNLLEIVFILRGVKGKRKTVIDIYILNLSFSDLIVAAFMIILKSMNPFMKTSLKENAVAKEIFDVLRFCFIRLSLFASVFNLIALTIDRVWAIKRPFSHRKRGTPFAKKVCIGVWFFAISCSLMIYFMSRFTLNNVLRYNGLVFPIATYLATTVFVISYGIIYLKIRKSRIQKSKRRRETVKKTDEENVKEMKVHRMEMRFLLLASKTVISFVLCWFPYSTCILFKAIGWPYGNNDTIGTMFTFAIFNSVLNPFVYFQHVWTEIFSMCRGKRRRRLSSKSTRFTSSNKSTQLSRLSTPEVLSEAKSK